MQPSTTWLTRFVLLRLLGVIYLVAFLGLALQVEPLIGAKEQDLLGDPDLPSRVARAVAAGVGRYFSG